MSLKLIYQDNRYYIIFNTDIKYYSFYFFILFHGYRYKARIDCVMLFKNENFSLDKFKLFVFEREESAEQRSNIMTNLSSLLIASFRGSALLMADRSV